MRSLTNAVLCSFIVALLGGFPPWTANSDAAASALHGAQGAAGLIHVQYRSYLEGRDFRSYRQDRGFGARRFDSAPARDAIRGTAPSPDPERPPRLQRRFYGSGDSRCSGWSRRCDQRWGSGNSDYFGCMRYHGCR